MQPNQNDHSGRNVCCDGVMCLCAYVNYQNNKTDEESDLVMQNIEALTGDDSSDGASWIRTDGDCFYEISSKANATVVLTLGSLGSISLKCDANGYASYTARDAKTDCASGGNQKCQDRYCPIAFWK